MTTTLPTEMCRLVVCGPERQIELAVPAQVAIGDILPVLLQHLGDNLADAGLAHGGWVLQRLGEAPFDDDQTLRGLGLTDGATVHLRPRAEQIPPVHFDDLADGLATGVQDRAGRWRPEMSRWAAAGTLALTLAAGLWVLACPGPPLWRAVAASIVALSCVAAGGLMSRAYGDGLFAAIVTLAGAAYAGLAAAILPDATRPVTGVVAGAPELFSGAVVTVVVALLGAALIGRAGPVFAGAPVTGAAGVTAGLSMLLALAVPGAAFRLAGLRMAVLPTKPEHLQEEIEPEPSEQLLPRAAAADRYMTALYCGLGLAAAGALLLIAHDRGWAAQWLVVAVAAAQLLAVRPMTSGWHRLALAAPGLLGLVAVLVVALTGLTASARAAGLVLLAPIATVLLFLAARRLPGRRLLPGWGRLGDVCQVIATVAILPLTAVVLGLFGLARSLGG
jgi:type VII secretion integral membrane protein EccD